MEAMAEELARRFEDERPTKIITVEASGIAPAIMVGCRMQLPVVFAKENKPSTMEGMLTTKVFSFTKSRDYDICVSGDYLREGERVLFIDDFLANGNAALGVLELIRQAGAECVGMGFLIEKGFQTGGTLLRERGLHVESLAIVESLSDGKIVLREDSK
jgi:xanthine phosphoribosyltransferase